MPKIKKTRKATRASDAKVLGLNLTRPSTTSGNPRSPTRVSSQQPSQGRGNSSTFKTPENLPKRLPTTLPSSLPRKPPSTSFKKTPERNPAIIPAAPASVPTRPSLFTPNRALLQETLGGIVLAPASWPKNNKSPYQRSMTPMTPSRVKAKAPTTPLFTVKTGPHQLTPPKTPHNVNDYAPLHTPTALLSKLEARTPGPSPDSLPAGPLPFTATTSSRPNPGILPPAPNSLPKKPPPKEPSPNFYGSYQHTSNYAYGDNTIDISPVQKESWSLNQPTAFDASPFVKCLFPHTKMSPEENSTPVPVTDEATGPGQPIMDSTATSNQQVDMKAPDNQPSPPDEDMPDADQATTTPHPPLVINKGMPIDEQSIQTESTPVKNEQDDILEQVEARLVRGENELTIDEQMALYNCMDGIDKIKGDILAGAATLVCNRSSALSFKLAHWFYQNERYALVQKLLEEHLNDLQGAYGGDLMAIEDVDTLMDCQIVLEMLMEEMDTC